MKSVIPFKGGHDHDWRTRAADAIPGGCSTGSKRPDALYGSRALDAAVPTHYERAEGCLVWAPDGRRFVDCSMAYLEPVPREGEKKVQKQNRETVHQSTLGVREQPPLTVLPKIL